MINLGFYAALIRGNQNKKVMSSVFLQAQAHLFLTALLLHNFFF